MWMWRSVYKSARSNEQKFLEKWPSLTKRFMNTINMFSVLFGCWWFLMWKKTFVAFLCLPQFFCVLLLYIEYREKQWPQNTRFTFDIFKRKSLKQPFVLMLEQWRDSSASNVSKNLKSIHRLQNSMKMILKKCSVRISVFPKMIEIRLNNDQIESLF
jgi:hypothetical protein